MRKRSRRRNRGTVHTQKADRAVHHRVRKVGPEHFGILVVDPSKKRYVVMLTNYYGQVLMEPQTVSNTRPGLDCMVQVIKEQCKKHHLKDTVVGIERTGRYHRPARRVLQKHWDVLMIHPFATKQLRQPVNPGNKTDTRDLEAMVRAVTIGYGRTEETLPERWLQWRVISRAREDLVRKASTLRVQIKERLEGLMPGYAGLFSDLWNVPVALAIAQRYSTPSAVAKAGAERICSGLRRSKVMLRRDTVQRVLIWARGASSPDPCAHTSHRILCDWLDLLRQMETHIQDYERELVEYLVDSPFVLLMGIQGINVVSSASYGAELGPIEHYMNAKRITGRAGVYPSRYQSDQTDLADGPLVGGRNARLRDALMEIAHNLIRCNSYFRGWAEIRRKAGWPAKKIHLAVVSRFSRISYWMLAGQMVFQHPCAQQRDTILPKIVTFAQKHEITPQQTGQLLLRAMAQIPPAMFKEEAAALEKMVPRRVHRRSNPQRISDILPEVISKLGLHLSPRNPVGGNKRNNLTHQHNQAEGLLLNDLVNDCS